MAEKVAPKDRPGWDKELAFAQTRETYQLEAPIKAPGTHESNGSLVDKSEWLTRLRHASDIPCKDCGALSGQLHVPGCELEMCPRCELLPDRCNCSYRETWHKLPQPDKAVPWNGRTVDPVVTCVNGLVQLDRFHIVEFSGSYIILIKGEAEYVLSPLIFPAAHAALTKLPPPQE